MNYLKTNETIAIIGLGYVGLPLALLAAKKRYRVIGIVKTPSKAALINRKISPIKDEDIIEDLKTTTLEATTDFRRIRDASIIVVCVPTPIDSNHMPDLEPVESATRNIGRNLQKGQTVIMESTVNPGICEEVMLPILENESGLDAGKDFYFAHCPERINPGDPRWNVENINRVLGASEERGLDIATKFYRSILTSSVKQMNNLKEAEACKVVENSFRDINIAFVNELALSFSKLGIDVVNVIDGASTKPFGFMAHYPGCGVGGHCIPVDPYYLIEYAKKNGFFHDFLSLARRINNSMPEYTANLVIKGLNEKGIAINGANVTVLGVAYKGNIDDDRESPSYDIVRYLKESGANVSVYDPYVVKKSTVHTIDEALTDAKAIVLATGHNAFRVITAQRLKAFGIEVLVDGRNFYDKDEVISNGIVYKGIGK